MDSLIVCVAKSIITYPILQRRSIIYIFITILSLKWIYDLLSKLLQRKRLIAKDDLRNE